MQLSEDLWRELTNWFDTLAELAPESRQQALPDDAIRPEIRHHLDALLAAHDAPEPLLLDRTLETIALSLLPQDAAHPPPASWEGVALGHWRIIREIKRGGMATVVLAERADGHYERQVALKVLHTSRQAPSERDSLERELRILARLSHPGIVHLLDGGVSEQGWPYLVMELVDGIAIDVWCEKHRASLDTRIKLLRQVASAVTYAHSQLIVHADLKPSNILVEEGGRVRLVDFGIGALLDRDRGGSIDQKLIVSLRCSPAWAAPEQLRGEPAQVASDIHGMGMLMRSLLTGMPPRSGRAAVRALAGQIMAPEPAQPSDHPACVLSSGQLRGDLDAICEAASAPSIEDRYPSADAFDRDLAAWQSHRPVIANPLGMSGRIGKWLARNRGLAAAASITSAAIIGGSGVAVWQATRAQVEARQASLQAQRAETIKDFLLSMFTAADPWLAGDTELDIRDILAQGGRQLQNDQSLETETRLELLITLGDVHVALGDYAAAEDQFEQARTLLYQHAEMADEWRVRLLLERASLSRAKREPQNTEDLLNRANDLLPSAQSDTGRMLHARVAEGYANLFARQNRPNEALLAFERLERLLALPGEPLQEYELLLLGARTTLAFNRGELEQAYRLVQAELELLQTLDQSQRAKTITTLSNLAAIAAQLGRLDQALEYDQQAVDLARDVYPADHPSLANTLYALGDTQRQHGQFELALVTLDQAREIQAARGTDVNVALTDMIRSRVFLALGQGTEAARFAASARAVLEPSFGTSSRTVLQALDFELQGHALTERRSQIQGLESVARQRLDSLEESDRWQPLAQMLRWRIARIHHDLDQDSNAGAWLNAALLAPDSATRHASVELRLLGLDIRLRPAANGAADPRVEAIERHSIDAAANADSRAFAWCSVAIDQVRRGADRPAPAFKRLDDIAASQTLSFEGRRDAACQDAATESENDH